MNIFVTDPNPVISAQRLDDKRVVKMVLESAQMLSTAIWECGGTGFYKKTHTNHPCSIWARTTKKNYIWLYNHFQALLQEYTARYRKTHKCADYIPDIIKGFDLIPDGDLTPFANCTTYKEETNIHKAYQMFMCDKWENDKRTPRWYGVER